MLLAALLLCQSIGPAQAFELFGFEIFGSSDDDPDAVEIIDPQPYEVSFEIETDDDDLRELLQGSSALAQRRDQPASGAAGLIATAKGDYRRLLAALYIEGYYAGAINIRVEGQEASNLPVTMPFPDVAKVRVLIDPGPQFLFGETRFVNEPPQTGYSRDQVDTTARQAFSTGEIARADAIDEATDEALEAWRQLGRAKAALVDREVIADHTTDRLDVQVVLDPGPVVNFGPVSVEGTNRVKPEFIRYMADLPEGAEFDPDRVASAEARLARMGTFRSFRIREADDLTDENALPFVIEVDERKPRRFGVGATISSIEGAGLEAYWLHRNLWGRADRFRLEASVVGLGVVSDYEELDYELGASLSKPGFLTPGATLITSLVARQEVLELYRERSVTASVGLERIVNVYTVGSIALEGKASEIEDDGVTESFRTISLVLDATYDRRNDPNDATEGYFLSGELRPFYETEFGNEGLRSIVEGRAYYAIDDEEKFVLAGRARIGSLVGDPREELPTDLLFLAGGGGSVRGYPFRSIGVEVAGETEGGRSSVELSAELRVKLTRNFGLVGFADAGYVSDTTFPTDGDFQVGLGAGIRYKTGLGPIRLDIARAVDPRPGDPDIAFYLGIGQAF